MRRVLSATRSMEHYRSCPHKRFGSQGNQPEGIRFLSDSPLLLAPPAQPGFLPCPGRNALRVRASDKSAGSGSGSQQSIPAGGDAWLTLIASGSPSRPPTTYGLLTSLAACPCGASTLAVSPCVCTAGFRPTRTTGRANGPLHLSQPPVSNPIPRIGKYPLYPPRQQILNTLMWSVRRPSDL